MTDPSLVRFRTVVASALAQLEARRQEVNDLNVFPVADGDTGDNMVLTLRAVLAELDRLAGEGDRSIDEIGRDEIVESVARAALLGARGNSGVILSQLIRGAAEELISRPGELVDPALIGASMARAADRAYASVRDPKEGTILTVMREMASQVSREVAHAEHARFDGPVSDDQQNAILAAILEPAIEAGTSSVERGPELLDVLRKAGVVDAGGYALTIIFAGVVAALRGDEAPEIAHQVAPARVTHPEHESSTFRYCTNFAVTGRDLEAQRYTAALESLGDSLLVVGDRTTLKVHVHTDDPEAAIALFAGAGEVSHLDVADMHAQVAERSERLAASTAASALVAVVTGDGMHELFRGIGARPLDGGPTLNPATSDLLTAIHDADAEDVIVLPNSANVVMAAERAAELSEKRVWVLGAHSQQAGLASAIAFDPSRSGEENAAAIAEALERIRTGAVAPAARDDVEGRFAVGEAVGFVDGEVIAWGEPQPTLAAVIAALADGSELITCITGLGAPLGDEAVEGLAPASVELELSVGGQPSYWWLLAAE